MFDGVIAMSDKNSMIFYYDWADDFEDMSDEEVGRITRAIMAYERTGEDADFPDRSMRQLFRRMKKAVDENKKKYLKRSRSARKSANARWSKNANACERISENAFDADNVTVTVTDTVTDTATQCVCVTEDADASCDTHTREAVRSFFSSKGFKSDPDRFIDYNLGRGNDAIFESPKRWQAVARNWEKNEKSMHPPDDDIWANIDLTEGEA